MNIRPATEQDVPSIVSLLKLSLGDALVPKSHRAWNWKHQQNPFGVSFILLAEEGNILIGVRAFMQWEWQWKGKTYKAIRAVDTATHPDHQGKGIFKKLTLHQVALCKEQGVHFVFNTPNQFSRPGYLKMGWVLQGKMPLKMKLLRPVHMAYSKLFQRARSKNPDPTPVQLWTESVFELMEQYQQPHTDFITCRMSAAYIRWRYADNPLFRYNYFTDGKNYLLVCRIKDHGFTKELRLTDFVLLNSEASIQSHIKSEVRDYCRSHKIGFISISGRQYQLYEKYFAWMGLLPVKPLGPSVTLKDLNMKEDFSKLLGTGNWAYALGDMELF